MSNIRDINEADFYKVDNLAYRIRFLLRYAILAPSTHNTQPWLFKVEGNICEIYFIEKLRLPEADPTGRDFFISMGCAIENLVIAAKYFGIFEKEEIFPYMGGPENLVGKIYFKENTDTKDNSLKPLLDAMLVRVNARGKFQKKQIPEQILPTIKKMNDNSDFISLHLIENPNKINEIASLTVKGLELAHSKNSFRKEMFNWINSSFSGRKEGMPGYSLGVPALLSPFVPYLIRKFDMGKKLGEKNYASISSAPAIAVISAKINNKNIWVDTGRLAEQIMLYCASQGIKTSIFVASVEMGRLHMDLRKILETDEIPQFLFCMGHMKKNQKPNLRHDIDEKIIK